jgi:hypothetical protein
MALAATYDVTLSRIRLALTAAAVGSVTATFDRSIDAVNWTTVRGGSSVSVSGSAANVDDYEFPAGQAVTYRVRTFDGTGAAVGTAATTVVTQDLDAVWVKVPAVPYLNTPVTVTDRGEITRKSRAGVFDIVGRSLPVLVGDVTSGISYTLQLLTNTPAEERDLDYTLSTGDVIFLHLPSSVDYFPGGYFAVGDVRRHTTLRLSARRLWDVPLTQVAAPGPAVIGSAYTCASVLAQYATVSDVITGNLTIVDLLERTGSPSDVLVP